ncbi:MAG TPA: hypothetical protein VHS59_05535 [Bacillota bacterium]|nr:hypothetical protein [Bacillota bacterium]
MSRKEKGPQFILKVPSGVTVPPEVTTQPEPETKQGSAEPEAPSSQAAELSLPGPEPASQPEVKITESYLAKKLRVSEQAGTGKPTQSIVPDEDTRMADMWQEMENQIHFKVPKAAKLPGELLQSLDMEGETILASPKAVEVLKGLSGGKKNG